MLNISTKVGGPVRQPVRVAAGAVIVLAFAGCGGGIEADNNGEAERLVCATACKPSSTLAIGQIRPSFVVVGDGARVQAQAGFSAGSDVRFNVEIEGADSLRLRTSRGTQGFHIPASSLSTIVVDVLRTLVAGAPAYLSEVTPSAGAEAVQFEFVRGSTVFAASVELPAPYQILNPTNWSTLALSGRNLAVRLSGATAPEFNEASFNCADINGNTATGSAPLSVVPGSVAKDASGISYALAVGAAIDALSFTSTYPRSAVARCDVELKLMVQAAGVADPNFASAQVLAQQIRSVSVALR